MLKNKHEQTKNENRTIDKIMKSNKVLIQLQTVRELKKWLQINKE